MSEAELQWLGLRLYGARQSKARRAELELRVPTGYAWNGHKFVLSPDEAVQQALRTVFERFSVETSAWAVVRWAREATSRSLCAGSARVRPRNPLETAHGGRVRDLLHDRITRAPMRLRPTARQESPRRRRGRQAPTLRRRPAGWMVCIRDAHEGYITWDAYLKNREKLRDNTMGNGSDPRAAPRARDVRSSRLGPMRSLRAPHARDLLPRHRRWQLGLPLRRRPSPSRPQVLVDRGQDG